MYDECSIIGSKGKHKTTHGEGFKVSTRKQIFQRLPIALAQVKKGNTSTK